MPLDDLTALVTSLGYGEYVPLLTALAVLFPHIVAKLPPAYPSSSALWRFVRAVLDALAGNYGNAKNAPPVTVTEMKP